MKGHMASYCEYIDVVRPVLLSLSLTGLNSHSVKLPSSYDPMIVQRWPRRVLKIESSAGHGCAFMSFIRWAGLKAVAVLSTRRGSG